MIVIPNAFKPLAATFARLTFGVTAGWRLTEEETAILLGAKVEQLAAWRSGHVGDVTYENVVRFDYIVGMGGALEALLGKGAAANDWVRRPNKHAIFEGATALEFMLDGGAERIELVHRYLAGEAWG